MLKRNRLMAVFIVLLLVFSVFTMLANPTEGAAVSDEELTPDSDLGWLSGFQWWNSDIEDTGAPEEDVYVGQKGVEFTPEYTFNYEPAEGREQLEISYQTTTTDEYDIMKLSTEWDIDPEDREWTSTVSPLEWEDDEDTGTYTFNQFNQEQAIGTFEFDVNNNAEPGIYRIPIRLVYSVYDGTEWSEEDDTFEFIYLEVANNAAVDNFALEPGFDFERVNVRVTNEGGQNLEDVFLTLGEDDLEDDAGNQVTIHNPNGRSYVDNIASGWFEDFNFRFSVPFEMDPGEYPLEYTLEATRDEEHITETGTIMVYITPMAELSAVIEDNEIVQGTSKRNFVVNITNTGNLDLERISVGPDVDNSPFTIPDEYYENYEPESDEVLTYIGDLDINESAEFEITLGIDQEIQIGRHKLFFNYEAFYYDTEGEITGEEGYIEVEGNLDADTDEPYAWIIVNEPDVTREIFAHEIDAIGITEMGYQEISITIENRGYVVYSDIVLNLHTEGTPFVHPSDPNQDMIRMKGESFQLGTPDWETPSDTQTINFGVMIDTAFIEERLGEDRPIYNAELTFEGLNNDMLEDVEYTLHADGEVFGVGPKIMVREPVQENKVEVGESFYLTYIVENIGDEPVRNLEISIQPALYGDVETEFSEGQEAIYYRQAVLPPGPYVSTVEPEQETLEPGENTSVTFHMKPSSDMQEGSLYFYELNVNGETQPGRQDNWRSGTTIRTVEESSTRPLLSYNLALVLVAIILGVFFALGVFIYKKDKNPKAEKEEPEQEPEYEEEYTYEEIEEEEIEPEPAAESEWEEKEPPAPEDEIFEEDDSQIEPDNREEW